MQRSAKQGRSIANFQLLSFLQVDNKMLNAESGIV